MIRRHRTTVLVALTAALALSACGGGGDPLAEDEPQGGGSDGASAGGDTLVIGSANFPENVLLAEIYAAALGDAGVDVETNLNIGNREAYMAGLEDGSIDLIPEYTGNLALFLNEDAEATASDEVYAELQEALPENLTVLDMAEAEDKDSVVVTAETAEKLGLTTIADLKPEAPNLVLGGPPEWRDRFTGVPGLQEVYGLEFSEFKPLDAGSTLTVQALVNGQIDAGNIFSTDPAIVENDFVVLEDNESLFAAQNVVPLISTDAVTPEIKEALNGVSAGLTTQNLTDMMVQVQDGDPAAVAREFVDGL
ncbi:ABC transporter substrate-binding protein [Ornithinimicrobium faecis]|uniref:ABC transporter substrate-binding protein n=1 Tax=Ornithinimicrobium faecis TaxID=2934158 RepID=A0ABY4YUI3_9MICO|nr:ABC transporter substrate-binding protein [Ornithinimicrobium sp. HY1793]USQ80431.1 ABC transporter substrate-binding protein [Ornithinimicrobium sp. HY1793]